MAGRGAGNLPCTPFLRKVVISREIENFRQIDGNRTAWKEAPPDGAKPLKCSWLYFVVIWKE